MSLPVAATVSIVLACWAVLILILFAVYQVFKTRGSCKCDCAPCGKADDSESCTCCRTLSDSCNCCNPSVEGCLNTICPSGKKKVSCVDLLLCQCTAAPGEQSCCIKDIAVCGFCEDHCFRDCKCPVLQCIYIPKLAPHWPKCAWPSCSCNLDNVQACIKCTFSPFLDGLQWTCSKFCCCLVFSFSLLVACCTCDYSDLEVDNCGECKDSLKGFPCCYCYHCIYDREVCQLCECHLKCWKEGEMNAGSWFCCEEDIYRRQFNICTCCGCQFHSEDKLPGSPASNLSLDVTTELACLKESFAEYGYELQLVGKDGSVLKFDAPSDIHVKIPKFGQNIDRGVFKSLTTLVERAPEFALRGTVSTPFHFRTNSKAVLYEAQKPLSSQGSLTDQPQSFLAKTVYEIDETDQKSIQNSEESENTDEESEKQERKRISERLKKLRKKRAQQSNEAKKCLDETDLTLQSAITSLKSNSRSLSIQKLGKNSRTVDVKNSGRESQWQAKDVREDDGCDETAAYNSKVKGQNGRTRISKSENSAKSPNTQVAFTSRNKGSNVGKKIRSKRTRRKQPQNVDKSDSSSDNHHVVETNVRACDIQLNTGGSVRRLTSSETSDSESLYNASRNQKASHDSDKPNRHAKVRRELHYNEQAKDVRERLSSDTSSSEEELTQITLGRTERKLLQVGPLQSQQASTIEKKLKFAKRENDDKIDNYLMNDRDIQHSPSGRKKKSHRENHKRGMNKTQNASSHLERSVIRKEVGWENSTDPSINSLVEQKYNREMDNRRNIGGLHLDQERSATHAKVAWGNVVVPSEIVSKGIHGNDQQISEYRPNMSTPDADIICFQDISESEIEEDLLIAFSEPKRLDRSSYVGNTYCQIENEDAHRENLFTAKKARRASRSNQTSM